MARRSDKESSQGNTHNYGSIIINGGSVKRFSKSRCTSSLVLSVPSAKQIISTINSTIKRARTLWMYTRTRSDCCKIWRWKGRPAPAPLLLPKFAMVSTIRLTHGNAGLSTTSACYAMLCYAMLCYACYVLLCTVRIDGVAAATEASQLQWRQL